MQEVFEKIKESLEEDRRFALYEMNEAGVGAGLERAIEIVNQVAEEYIHHNDCENCLSTEYIQDKLREMYEDGYTKALDDAIEKFLEYGCFMIQWSPRLSKEKLVTDVLHQAKGQVVYTLEKMKEKYGTDTNVGSNEFCEWKADDREFGVFYTKCGNVELFSEGSPSENEYKYCPYCGKEIKVVE